MESNRPCILACGRRTPLTFAQHFALVMLWYVRPASLADIRSSLWITVTPLQILPLQPLHVIAMWTRDKISALIRCQIFRLNPARIFYRWCGRKDDLPTREG